MSYGITYKAKDWVRSSEMWADFGGEWAEVRQIAAARGMLYPPSGTKWDSWTDRYPSQAAVVWHALDYQPFQLKVIIRSSSSWSQVVDRIFAMFDRLRADADDLDRDVAWERDQQPTHREAAMTVGEIMRRAADSLP